MCKIKDKPESFVIKYSRKDSNEEYNNASKQFIEREAKFLTYLNAKNAPVEVYEHHGCTMVYGFTKGNSPEDLSQIELNEIYYIITKYDPSPSLFNMLSLQGPFSVPVALFIFREIVLSLSKIHSLKICHQNLKPDSIILTKENKIIFLGFSKAVPGELKKPLGMEEVGPFQKAILAPEAMSCEFNPFFVDLYSLGQILFSLVTNMYPGEIQTKYARKFLLMPGSSFWGESNEGLIKLTEEEAKIPGRAELKQKQILDLMDLIIGLLSYTSTSRYSLSEILGHPVFQIPMPPLQDILKEIESRRNNCIAKYSG